MTLQDTAAVKALIESAGSLTGKVHVTLAPPPTAPATVLPMPYVIVHPAEGTDDTDRVTGPKLTTHPEFTLHVVGLTAASVQTVLPLIKAKFITAGRGIPVTVTGRRNKPPYWRAPMPLQTDRDVIPWLVYAVIELGWTSDPST
jgi:hypothetical protein